MDDFPANSAKVRKRPDGPPPALQAGEPQPKIEQVTSAGAVRRRRGLGRKFKETFVGGSARGALDYMFVEVVVPAIQETVIDAVQGGFERLIRGEGRGIRRGGYSAPPSYSNQPRISYDSISRPTPANRTLSQAARARHDFGEIVIPHRHEAEEVLERMYDVLSQYGSVPVSTLYSLTGIQSSHTDEKWGWVNLRGARIDRLRNGSYALNLPTPEPLDYR